MRVTWLSQTKSVNKSRDPTPDSATLSIPCVKLSLRKSTPTALSLTLTFVNSLWNTHVPMEIKVS